MMRLFAVTELYEDVKAIVSETGPYGLLGGAMFYGWRITNRATSEAHTVRKTAYVEALKHFETERAAWAAREAQLLERVSELVRADHDED